MAELMPINSPLVFTKAPPLLPWFTAASVCKKDSTGLSLCLELISIDLFFALIIPAVIVTSKLKGYPIASTHWPNLISSLLPYTK